VCGIPPGIYSSSALYTCRSKKSAHCRHYRNSFTGSTVWLTCLKRVASYQLIKVQSIQARLFSNLPLSWRDKGGGHSNTHHSHSCDCASSSRTLRKRWSCYAFFQAKCACSQQSTAEIQCSQPVKQFRPQSQMWLGEWPPPEGTPSLTLAYRMCVRKQECNCWCCFSRPSNVHSLWLTSHKLWIWSYHCVFFLFSRPQVLLQSKAWTCRDDGEEWRCWTM